MIKRFVETSNRGFTLTEAAIVLGIVGLILGAIWVAASSVYGNLRVNKGNTAVMQLLQGVRSLYAEQASIPSGIQNTSLIQAGVIPADMIQNPSTGALRDPWSGAAFVGGTGDGAGIVIQMNNIPQSDCVKLVSTVGGNSRDAGLYQATGRASSTSYVAVAALPATPLTAAIQPTVTSTNCSNTINGVTFVFGLRGS